MSKLNEALTSTQIEREIVKGVNGETVDPEVQAIIEYLHYFNIRPPAQHIGLKQFTVTDGWSEYNPGKSLPKTDLIIGDMRISMKTKDRYQIMNANRNESLAIFNTVSEEMSLIKSKVSKDIINNLQDFVLHAVSKSTVGKARSTDPVMIEASKAHKELTQNLSVMFSNNNLFKKNFIKEVLTGEHKFGKSSEACATHIFTVTPNEMVLSPIDNTFVSMVASNVMLDISFSSAASKGIEAKGKYRYWSVIRMIVDHLFESKIIYANGRMNESGIHYLKTLITNVLQLFTSFRNMLYFLEIEPNITISG